MNKEKTSQPSSLQEIREKFVDWRRNMYLALLVCFSIFFSSEYIIDFVKSSELVDPKNPFLMLAVEIILGLLFLGDSKITSYLKTPLQRLAIKIENADLPEEKKKELLQSTQEANELFKETFKKFGILAVPTMVTGLLKSGPTEVWGEYIDEIDGQKKKHKIGWIPDDNPRGYKKYVKYVRYTIPIIYASWIIWDIERMTKKLNKITEELENKEKH